MAMPAPLLARSPRDRIRTRPRLGCARSNCMAERPQGLLLPGRPPACSWSHKSRSLRASRVSRVDRWRCVCVSRSAERKTGSGSPLLGLPESLADWTALEVLVCVADATSLLRLFRSSMARTSVVHLVDLSSGRPMKKRRELISHSHPRNINPIFRGDILDPEQALSFFETNGEPKSTMKYYIPHWACHRELQTD